MSFTPLDDDLSNFGKIFSWELTQALKENIESMYSSVPVGEICAIMTNIPGVVIDPNIWQPCDGSPITCPTSPIRGTASAPRYTPNFGERYIKMPSSIGLIGSVGGNHAVTGFAHTHGGGQTGAHISPRGIDWSDGDDSTFNVAEAHVHGIAVDLEEVYNMEPRFFTLRYFLKIQ